MTFEEFERVPDGAVHLVAQEEQAVHSGLQPGIRIPFDRLANG
jgi:hypothetical protein